MLHALTNRRAFAVAACMMLVAIGVVVALIPEPASGVAAAGKPMTTVTPNTASSIAEYTFARYKTAKNENVTGCSITFPAGTTVTSGTVTAIDPAGTVTVSGRTVTIAFDVPVVPEKTNFNVTIGGIQNPSAGTYNAGNMTLYTLNITNGTTGSVNLPTADYDITDSYISMTITTPGTGQSVDFGNIDPGVTTPAQQVTVQVDSSAPYIVSRTTGGDAALLGLTITGTATGSKPQGLATYTDAYTLTPPWTTDPSVPLTATVTYTVVQ